MEKPVQITRLKKREFFKQIFEIHKRQTRIEPQIPLSRLPKRAPAPAAFEGGPPAAVPDCVTCGACCAYGLIAIERRDPEPLSQYVELTPEDTSEVVIERYLERREDDGRCSNLTGTLGSLVGCSIYEHRPRTCRDFEAGSDRCFGYRRLFGIDPPLGPDELAALSQRLETAPQVVKVAAVDISVESKCLIFDRNAGPDAEPVAEELTLRIVAELNNGETRKIHSYDPTREHWYEHELEGIALEDALDLIEQRRVVEQ